MPVFRRWMDNLKQVGVVEGGTGSWGAQKTVTISGGVVAFTGAGRYLIDTEGAAASDDLDTITGLNDGDEVILAPASGSRTVVLKNGTGNLDIKTDISLNDAEDRVRLIKETTNLVEASSRP